jgi:hypothetical protein
VRRVEDLSGYFALKEGWITAEEALVAEVGV